MRKSVLRTAIFTTAVSLISVGSSFAGTITLDKDADLATTTDQGKIVIAAEGIPALQGQDYDLDPAQVSFEQNTGRAIIYQPGITLNEGDKIKFKLTNATFSDANYYFIVCEDMNGQDLNSDTDTVDCFELGNIVAGGQGNDYAIIRIAKPTGVTIGPNTKYVLAAGNSSVSGGAPYNKADNPTITLNNGISSSSIVTIGVEYAEDVGGTELTLAETSSTNLISFEQQIEISFVRGTSTIDVTSPSYRTKFVEEGSANDILTSTFDTDLIASSGVITVDNDSDNTVEDYIPSAGNLRDLKITIGDSGTDFSAWDFSHNRVYVDWGNNDTSDDTNYNFDPSTHIATLPGSVLPAWGNVKQDDIYIGVTGSDILNPQVIPVSAELSFTVSSYSSDTASDSQFITWDINGSQFKVPYLYNNASTWVRISNDGPVPGDISVDLYDEAGNKITNVSLGTVAANSSVVLYANNIVSAAIAAGWAAPTVTRFTAKFTVTAPAESISAIAVQRIPGGVDRVIPVLDNENTWDQ